MCTNRRLRHRRCIETWSTVLVAVFVAALAAHGPIASTAHGWDNRDRYHVINHALGPAAPPDNGRASGLAGVAFDGPNAPITFTNYDTPDRRSFGALNVAHLIYGPSSGGLGNPAAAWALGAPCTFTNGRMYGIKSDIRYYWSVAAAAPPYLACATNTHLMYNEVLRAVRTCGDRCFVDIASLSNIDVIRAELQGSIVGWLVGKPATARLVLRITEGYPVNNGDAIWGGAIYGQVDFFKQVVKDGGGKVEVYGVPITSGVPGGGTWSHAKLFAVYNAPEGPYTALIGGQNHWTDYDNIRPPFDTNTLVTGRAATLPALQIDAAIRWFDEGRDWVGRAAWDDGGTYRNTKFKWNTRGYENVSFERFTGIRNVNPGSVAGPSAAAQKVLVSLIDMGAYSKEPHLGRTISRALHDLAAAEPRTMHIRVFNQALCRPAGLGVDGNCSARNTQTLVGALVQRALTAAKMGWPANVWVLTSDSQIKNKGYPSPYSRNVRASLHDTGENIACTDTAFRPRWAALRTFNNPGGAGTCREAVVRALNAKFRWRMTTAFINDYAPRQPVGVHHKIVMFGRDAMFQGSYNVYQSGFSDAAPTYDSQLVENGGIILDPVYVDAQVDAFDEAWAKALPIIGG